MVNTTQRTDQPIPREWLQTQATCALERSIAGHPTVSGLRTTVLALLSVYAGLRLELLHAWTLCVSVWLNHADVLTIRQDIHQFNRPCVCELAGCFVAAVRSRRQRPKPGVLNARLIFALYPCVCFCVVFENGVLS